MVYFRFVKRNGRQFGPYYYISLREDKKVKSVFLGKNFKEAKKSLQKIPFEVKQKDKRGKMQNKRSKRSKIRARMITTLSLTLFIAILLFSLAKAPSGVLTETQSDFDEDTYTNTAITAI